MIGLDGEDNMEVKNRKLSSITAYGKNAKKHDKTQINNVAESIKQYGFVQLRWLRHNDHGGGAEWQTRFLHGVRSEVC